MKEICLVQVNVTLFKENDRLVSDDSGFWEFPYEETVCELVDREDFWGNISREDCIVVRANSVVEFEFFGAGIGEWTNALEWVADAMGEEVVFEDWVDTFRAYGKQLLEDTRFSRCNFVTVWEYYGWQEPDTWNGPGDYDEEWNCLGILDLPKLADGKLIICKL
jgi:hypothetical protein